RAPDSSGFHRSSSSLLEEGRSPAPLKAVFGPIHRFADALGVPLRSALGLLLQGWEYAADCQREAWEFAIEIQSLQQQGLTNSDLRWLLCKGLAKHRTENTSAAGPERSFHAGSSLAFTNRSCFILTATGL